MTTLTLEDMPRPRSLDEARTRQAIAGWIQANTRLEDVGVASARRLSGGAIQENWLLEVVGRQAGVALTVHWVLRTDAPAGVNASMSREQEFRILSLAHRYQVKVPQPIALCEDLSVLGRPFFLMQAIAGVAAGAVLTRDDGLSPARRRSLARELGANLARLHAISPPQPQVAFLPLPRRDPLADSIGAYRAYLDTLPNTYPVLEWGLRWVELNAPEVLEPSLIHRDFRTGNYMVEDGELTGILDWEFAAWGDPREDIGWFTAACWRFAGPRRVAGGIGRLDDFLAGYRLHSTLALGAEELLYWQVVAHLRWAIIALQQAQRHASGQQRSLELALTGRMLPEIEWQVLRLIKGDRP